MGVIRNLPGGNGHIRQTTGAKPKAPATKPIAQPTHQPATPQESVQLQTQPLTDTLPDSRAESKKEATPKGQTQAQTPAPQKRDDAPTTLLQETPNSIKADEDSTTNWVLESASQTPYADEPSLAVVRKRFGTLNEAVKKTLTEPLLEAITAPDEEVGSKKLKDLASTAEWAQKFKKDAARLAEEGNYTGMLQKARELEKKNSEPETRLDGIRQSDSLAFDTKLPKARADEANRLLEQFENGNEHPGIGSKALGKGIQYLRGRKGTRLFFRKKGDEVEWLAVCDKTNEPQAIKKLQKEYDL